MTENDLVFIKRLLLKNKIEAPVLELGAGYGGGTCRKIILDAGLSYFASDMCLSPGVDYVADFESDSIETSFPSDAKFNTILILNVLEHTFDPIRILDNAKKLLSDGGSMVVIAPVVWSLHSYPIDCCRLLPNWHEQYANSRGMTLDRGAFEYLGYGAVDSFKNVNGKYRFPFPAQGFTYWKSRIIHRLFNTFGRGMVSPSYLAIGVVLHFKSASCIPPGECN